MMQHMGSRTVIVSVTEGADSVYRVETTSSVYRLAIQSLGERRFALLQGHSRTAGREVDVRDSDPRIGVRSLFAVDPSDWIGECLQFGAVSTSPVTGVTRESGSEGVGAGGAQVTSSAAALVSVRRAERPSSHDPANEQREAEPPYPERHVEYAEHVAQLLRFIERRGNLVWDVEDVPHLRERLRVALTECARISGILAARFGPRSR